MSVGAFADLGLSEQDAPIISTFSCDIARAVSRRVQECSRSGERRLRT